MDKPYEFMEHTADVKFRAYGADLNEALSNSIIACTAVLLDPSKVETAKTKKISVGADSRESLLYELIQEIVFLIDTEGFVTGNILRSHLEGNVFTATLEGDSVSNYTTSGDIKSATYTEMEIHEEKDKAWIQTVLDI